MDFVSTTEQKVPVIINPTTAGGKPSTVEGTTVAVTGGNATFAAATDDEKAATAGLLGFVVSEDVAGVSDFLVTGDAQIGDGEQDITDTIHYIYTSPNAAKLGLSAGVAVPK